MGEATRQAVLPETSAGDDSGPVRVGAFGTLTPHGPAVRLVIGEHTLLLGVADVRLLALQMLDEAQLASVMQGMARAGLADKTIVRAVKAMA